MSNVLTPVHIKNLAKLLWPADPEMAVSPKWLFTRAGSINHKFVKTAVVTSEVNGDFQIVKVNGESFVWPREADLHALLMIVSELKISDHPHQYIYNETVIAPGDVVIDIGACEGSFSAYAARQRAKVIAVEPSRVMTQVINSLFDLRDLQQPTIVNALLGQEPQDLYFIDNAKNPGGSRVASTAEEGGYPMPVITLDSMVSSLMLEKVNFIKCDAEGADVCILKSGKNTLEKFHPKLAITTYHGTTDFEDLFSFLKPLGYQINGKGLLYTDSEFRVLMLHAW